MRTTIRDVARRAGVSTATVSRVLTNQASSIRISEPTAQRVLEAARDLDYTPNALASGLRSRQTRMIGVIVPDASMAFNASIVAALDEALGDQGYDFLLVQSWSGSARRRATRVFERYRVDGVVVVGERHNDAFVEAHLRALNGHIVGLSREAPGMPSVIVDNRLGVGLALQHLLDLGHERIAHVGVGPEWDPRQRRALAFVEHLAAAGLSPDPRHLLTDVVHPDAAAGAEAVERLLSLPEEPTAIFFSNDDMAIGGMAAAQRMGRAVPQDLAVVGFDDIPWANYCSPALTTVRQPVKPMVVCVVSVLLDLIEGRRSREDERPFVFPPELIVRASTAPPKASARLPAGPGEAHGTL